MCIGGALVVTNTEVSKLLLSNVICCLWRLENLLIDCLALYLFCRVALWWFGIITEVVLWLQSGTLGQMSCCAEWMETLPSVESRWDDTDYKDSGSDENRLPGAFFPLQTFFSFNFSSLCFCNECFIFAEQVCGPQADGLAVGSSSCWLLNECIQPALYLSHRPAVDYVWSLSGIQRSYYTVSSFQVDFICAARMNSGNIRVQ